MKLKKTFTALSLLLAGMLNASAGVYFYEEDVEWSDVVYFASSENKLIFVDVYADYCTPCKLMDREVFGNPEFAAYMNPRFINYKVNAGDDFKNEFEQLFNMRDLPATFVFEPSGQKRIEAHIGAKSPDEMMEIVRNAMVGYHGTENPTFNRPENFMPSTTPDDIMTPGVAPNDGTDPAGNPQNGGQGSPIFMPGSPGNDSGFQIGPEQVAPIGTHQMPEAEYTKLWEGFQKGEQLQPNDLRLLAYQLRDRNQLYGKVVNAYLEHYGFELQTYDTDMVNFVRDFTETFQNAAAYVFAQNAEFYRNHLNNAEMVNSVLIDIANKDVERAIEGQDTGLFKIVVEMMLASGIPNTMYYTYNYEMYYYKCTNDWHGYAETCKLYLSDIPEDDPLALDEIVANFVANVNDMQQLEYAVQWAEKSISLDDRCYNNHTAAELWFRLGEYGKARNLAYKAMAHAKAENLVSSPTLHLLEAIDLYDGNTLSSR